MSEVTPLSGLETGPGWTKAPEETTVVVGMSGGVDSSVAAYMLKQKGYKVVGLFMKNWEETGDDGECTSARDFEDVQRVCERIGIPYYAVEFVQEYWEQVFLRFVEEYKAGFTPNPDILCNREIKFDVFYRKAMAIGGDFLATGHYCRLGLAADASAPGGARKVLLKGADPMKDQSYFLNAVPGEAFERVMFPIGDIEKPEVRRIAKELGLATAAKKDSTGICFIGERKFRQFLSQYVSIRPGDFRTLDGRLLGRHQGAAFYTLGQRRGLGIGGPGEAPYVVAKDPVRNIVYVERGSDHPALYADELMATEISWIGKAPALPFECEAKVRYRQKDQSCRVEEAPGGSLRVVFDQPQRAITPGQSVVFYQGDHCLGGGVIRAVGPSYHEMGRSLPRAAPLGLARGGSSEESDESSDTSLRDSLRIE